MTFQMSLLSVKAAASSSSFTLRGSLFGDVLEVCVAEGAMPGGYGSVRQHFYTQVLSATV